MKISGVRGSGYAADRRERRIHSPLEVVVKNPVAAAGFTEALTPSS